MPLLVGGFAAMVALAAGILAHVDPLTAVWRAALALIFGWVGATVWHAISSAGRPDIESYQAQQESQAEPETS